MMSKSLAVGPGSGRQPAAAWAGLLACACLSLGLAGGHFSFDGPPRVQEVALADLNGDGAIDLFSGEETEGRVWLNDGRGRFRRSGQEIHYEESDGLALGDLTGDGVVDIFVAGVEAYQVWSGAGNGRFAAGPRRDFR